MAGGQELEEGVVVLAGAKKGRAVRFDALSMMRLQERATSEIREYHGGYRNEQQKGLK